MELPQSVAALEREVAELEARYAKRMREIRAPVDAAQAQLDVVKASIAEHAARRADIEAELAALERPPTLTYSRLTLAALSLGACTFGLAAGDVDLPHGITALFALAAAALAFGVRRSPKAESQREGEGAHHAD